MQSISLQINGKQYHVDSKLGPNYTLNDFIRHNAMLTGTKAMCKEGGCGVCIVHVTYMDLYHKKKIEKSINSCMIPVYACDGWIVLTIEGLGDRKNGYHTIQKRVHEYYGTQCGYCTPGFVMSMYGLLVENPKPTQQQIEDSFDGNICRCTGYRPILDAMKSLRNVKEEVPDIEEVNKACCGKKGYKVCNKSCQSDTNTFEVVNKDVSKTLEHPQGTWHQPHSLADAYKVLKDIKDEKIRLIVGNTGIGVFRYDGPYGHLMSMSNIGDLYEITETDSSIVFGANVTLSQMIKTFEEKLKSTRETSSSLWTYLMSSGAQKTGWEFCEATAHHLSYVANVPVRNAGSWAGNFMMKHAHVDFPSDVFLLMQTIDARVDIGDCNGPSKLGVPLKDFLHLDMTGKILLKLKIAKLTPNHVMRSFKITIRAQNSHAYINAGFLFELSESENFKVLSKPTILYGGVNETFDHATLTENYLNGKALGDPSTIIGALATLESEIKPNSAHELSSVAYRKSLSVSLFYKFVLGVLDSRLPNKYQSGGPNLLRPLSGGNRAYDTKRERWPITKAVPKLESMIQCSGEAKYAADIEPLNGQLYASFSLSTAFGNIDSIDIAEAMKMEGVIQILTAKDIPGENNFAKAVPSFPVPEELLASKKTRYNGQPIAIVLAETEYIAEKAAKLVKGVYSGVKRPLTNLREAVDKRSFWSPASEIVASGDVEAGFKKSHYVKEGEIEFGHQYHFFLETHSTSCVPTDIGLDVICATQMVNHCQGSIASLLNIDKNSINFKVKRLGGGFGGKLSRSFLSACGAALGAHLTNRPVLMHLPMETVMTAIGKRLPYLCKYKVGFTTEGKLNAVQIYYYDDCGSTNNEDYGVSVPIYGDSSYYCKNWKLVAVPVKTDTAANTSCRGPAWLQAISFIEEILENVAYTVGRSPIDVKADNLIENGQKMATGVVMNNCIIKSMVDEFREMSDFDIRSTQIVQFNQNNRWKKKGLSCVMMRFPLVYFGIKFNSTISVYGMDGTVSVSHAGIEMGQGVNTKVAQACAYELGIPLEMVKVKPTDAFISPNSTETGGDISSDLNSWATIKACEILKERMAPIKKAMGGNPSWLELIKECESKNVDLCARNEYSSKDLPSEYNIYGMTATEVEVDVLTGIVQVPRVDILFDGGESSSPAIDIGQIEGGYVMGLGLMLSEELKFNPDDGTTLVKNTWEYKPPTTKDIPIQFNIKFVSNVSNPLGVLRAKATGEPPLCMSSSALFAIRDAVRSARKDAGQSEDFQMNAPATPEQIQLSCMNSINQMKIK